MTCKVEGVSPQYFTFGDAASVSQYNQGLTQCPIFFRCSTHRVSWKSCNKVAQIPKVLELGLL